MDTKSSCQTVGKQHEMNGRMLLCHCLTTTCNMQSVAGLHTLGRCTSWLPLCTNNSVVAGTNLWVFRKSGWPSLILLSRLVTLNLSFPNGGRISARTDRILRLCSTVPVLAHLLAVLSAQLHLHNGCGFIQLLNVSGLGLDVYPPWWPLKSVTPHALFN